MNQTLKKMNSNKKTNFLVNYINFLRKMFPSIKGFIICNELYIKIPSNQIVQVMQFLKLHTNTQYKVLIDICAIDYPEKKFRFELVYHCLSITYNTRINVQTFIEDSFPIESVVSVHSGAGWMEREVWDMFGIFFTNHNDLRRILTDYGSKGHPLRKDYPLSGFKEVLYNEFHKKLEHKPVSLRQAYRNFTIKEN